jgi:hypothetical protein
MPSLIPEQLKAQIDRWRGRRGWESERVFAIRTDFPYVGSPEIICGGLAVKVADCRSDLEARDLMLDQSTQDGHGLLLLMRTDEDRIGEDVRARFAGKTVHTLDPREVLKEIYQATAIDPRISNDDELLEALVMSGAAGAGRKAPGGTLDLDFAWSVSLRQPELMNQRPDLVEILRWSLDAERWATVEALEKNLVPSFFEWVGERAGEVAGCLESLFTTDQTNLYLPLGLVVGDLFHERLDQTDGAADARVRVENYLNGKSLKPTEAAMWSHAAREVLDKRQTEERDRIAVQVDSILEGIRALPIASAFGFSRQGFKDRWLSFADDIDRLGKRKWETGSRAVFNSLRQLQNHALAQLHTVRLARAEMAARLAGYEANFAPQRKRATSLNDAAREFAVNDSFIDWARFSLSWGDPLHEVAEVYGRLVRRMAKARIEAQVDFGERVCHWHYDNESGGKGLIPIEDVVSKYVEPLASQRPVLLLVMDGMNFPAFHQLGRSLELSGWAAQRRVGEEFPSRVMSVLPSVTEHSRWALFSGKVQPKPRNTEAVAFREHAALANVRSKGKPLLFTKGDLGSGDSSALSIKVRDALAGSEHRVVAVVLNAIDDQLKTGGQLSLDWKVQDIGILPAILEAADQGKRLIVLTSDHGHIPEMENTKMIERQSEGEARFRHGEVSDEGERKFSGSRIEAAIGAPSVVLPITETLRYGQKSAGYHGGACDLEVLIPLAVFGAPEDEIEGYEAVDAPQPDWWNWQRVFLGDGTVKDVLDVPVKPKAKKKLVTNVDELPLFGGALVPAIESPGEPAWMAEFLKSDVYAEQKRLLGAAGPTLNHMKKVLSALDAGGDKLLMAGLAQAIGEQSFRMQGVLARVARFINVDSYEILEIDRDSDTIRLNRKLLASQFQLKL